MSDAQVQEALERYEYAESRDSEFRVRAEEELEFLRGNQWPESVKAARERDTENGARPCLVMDKLSQYCRQVINDARQNRPSIKVRAVEDGDSGVAGVIQGLTRNIEDVSRADIAYDRGLEGSTYVGRGWIRVNTEYSREDSSEQDIRVLSVPEYLSPLPDPDYREPDGADLQYVFLPRDMLKAEYKRLYPRAKAESSFESKEGWFSDKYVRVAEYFSVYYESKKLLRLSSGHEVFEDALPDLQSQYEGLEVNGERAVELPRIKWCKLNGVEILEETEWLGKWIPLVPVHGNEVWVGGKRYLWGMIRPGMDPQRLYNYSRSSFAEKVSLAPKAPWVVAEGQIEGYEGVWAKANRVNLAYLPYKPTDIAGHQVPPPQRVTPAQIEAGFQQDMLLAEHDIQSSLGMYAPSIGQPSNERSGKAILARQREGDIGAYHYRDNLGRSIRQVGRIIVDLIPKIYDTRRVVRIIGEDGVESQVVLDPRTQQPVTEVKLLSGEVRKIYNPGMGTYDVTISTGPGYATKREEAANAILQLTQAAPQLFGIVGDLLVKSMDWPYADEIARRLRLLLPPALKPEGEGKGIPPEAQAKITQLTQAMQLVTQKAQEVEQERMKLQGIVDGKVVDRAMKQDEAKVKLQELEVRRMEVVNEKLKLLHERDKLTDDAEAREAEALVKASEGMKAESDFGKLASAMQDGFGKVVEGLQQTQQALQALAQGVVALGTKMDEHETGRMTREGEAREHMTKGFAESEARSLPAIEKMISAAQTVAVVPELDGEGNVVGGRAVQRDGKSRNIDLKKEA